MLASCPKYHSPTGARLEHPHIVRVLDFDLEDDTPFLVMSYAPQGSLRDRHPKGTILPLTSIVSYVKQVASDLQCAHDQKLIHRDVKPENMLLDQSGNILLSDFGIAIIAHSTYSMSVQNEAGTIPYMAPEQIQGKAQQASDQYALGIVVYEWLTGSCPFRGSYWEIATQHIAVPPSSLQERVPSILPDIERVVMTALAKDSKQRFATVQAFATALEQASQLAPIPHALPLVTTTLDQSLHPTDMNAPLKHPLQSSNQSMVTSSLEESTQPNVIKTSWNEPAQSEVTHTPSVAKAMDTPSLTSQPNFIASSNQPPLYNFRTAPLMQPPLSPTPTPSISKTPLPSHENLIHRLRRNPLFSIMTLLIILVLLGIAYLSLFTFQSITIVSATVNFGPQVHAINKVFQINGSVSQSAVDVNSATIPVKTGSLSKSGSQTGQTSQQCFSGTCQQIVTNDDVNRIEGQLRQSLDAQISTPIQQQLQTGGAVQVSSTVFITTSSTSDPSIGTPSKTVTVTMTEQGQFAYFLKSDAQSLASALLNREVQNLGANYALFSPLTRIGQPVVTNIDSSGIVFINIAAGGDAEYHFSPAELLSIQNALKNIKIKDAISRLQQRSGVDPTTVSIYLSSGDTMPSDIQQIKIITINPTNLPPVQLSPVSASPTPTTYSASFLRGYMRQF